MLGFPPPAYLIHPGSCLFRSANHHEHGLQGLVSALTDIALQQLFNGNQQSAGVGEFKPVQIFFNDDSSLALIISVDQGVDQGLANGFVNNGIPLAEKVTAELKGKLQIPRQALNNKKIELKQVGGPGAVYGQSVGPTDFGVVRELFPVIHMKLRHPLSNGLVCAEHEQSRNSQPLYACLAIPPPAPQFFQQAQIFFTQPGVVRFVGGKTMPELLEAGMVEIIQGERFENPAVSRLLSPVRQHTAHLLLRAVIVAFKIAAVGPGQRVLAQKYRPLVTGGPRYPDGQDQALFMIHFCHIGIGEQIGAHFAPVVDGIPERFFYPGRIRDPADRAVIFNTEQDDASMGVGHGAVCFPQAFRHSAPGRLELQFFVLVPLEQRQNCNGVEGPCHAHSASLRTLILPVYKWPFRSLVNSLTCPIATSLRKQKSSHLPNMPRFLFSMLLDLERKFSFLDRHSLIRARCTAGSVNEGGHTGPPRRPGKGQPRVSL